MKALFFDVDGTLIDGRNGLYDIPEGVKKELKRIRSEGHKIFISSGRPKTMMENQFNDVEFDGYVLANGGYVEVDGQSIFEDRMDYELVVKTVNMLDELNCEYMLETSNKIYIDSSFKTLYHFFAKNGHQHYFTFDFHKDDVMKKTIKIEMNVTNQDKERVENHIRHHFGYVVNFDEHGSDNAFEMYSPIFSTDNIFSQSN